MAELLEDEILSRTLENIHRLGLMFTPQSQLLKMSRHTLAVDALYGDHAFRWVGTFRIRSTGATSHDS